MTLVQKIDDIETAIFDYETKNVMIDIAGLFSEIIDSGAVETNNPNILNQLNKLMADCLAAMQNKDYLLLADQLEFVLKPIIEG